MVQFINSWLCCVQSINNDWIGAIIGDLALKNSSCEPDSVDVIFFPTMESISAFSSFSLLAVLLLHYLCLCLDLIAPPLSSLMTASRADRQIYLHWWRKGRREEEIISRGPSAQPSRLGQAEQIVWLLPVEGISLSVLSLGLRVLSWMGPKLDQTHTVPHQPLGDREEKTESVASTHTGYWQIPQDQWFIFPTSFFH